MNYSLNNSTIPNDTKSTGATNCTNYKQDDVSVTSYLIDNSSRKRI